MVHPIPSNQQLKQILLLKIQQLLGVESELSFYFFFSLSLSWVEDNARQRGPNTSVLELITRRVEKSKRKYNILFTQKKKKERKLNLLISIPVVIVIFWVQVTFSPWRNYTYAVANCV